MHEPDDPQGVPLEHVGRLEIQYAVDTNFIGDPSPAALRLRELRDGGWIRLVRADVLGTELGAAPARLRGQLEAEAARFVELLGPAVVGHSRVDASVVGSAADEQRLAEVLEALFPGSSLPPTSRTAEHNLRDAMHVATAIRYGLNGFLTRDRRVSDGAERIRERFDGFTVGSPESVLPYVERRLYGWRFVDDGGLRIVDDPEAP